jgi:hypothetical protein
MDFSSSRLQSKTARFNIGALTSFRSRKYFSLDRVDFSRKWTTDGIMEPHK